MTPPAHEDAVLPVPESPGAAATSGGEGRSASLTAADVARLTGGEIVAGGDAGRVVTGVSAVERAGPSDVTFLASAKYAAAAIASRAGVLLVTRDLAASAASASATRVVVANPHEAMLSLLPVLYRPPVRTPGVHPTAVLGRGVTLGADVTVGPYAVLGDGVALGDRAWVDAHCVVGAGVTIAEDARLHPAVCLYPGAIVGRRVTLHSGVRIGSDGFGYVYRDGAHQKIPHVGRCVIEDDVEIGANTTIDRGSVDDTVIGAGTKIDNLVHIGHNVRVGRLCLIMAQVGVAGSTRIEDGCIIAGQAGIGGHIVIGKGARIGGQAGVFGSVPAGATWSGYPARPHRDALRAQAAVFKLPSLIRKLERLADGDVRGDE
ncbi:MAG TPA: UDP-3-O-(3-hydroxymyristoyl)glucosamine N-acyltransferase [Gaiellaceae bacterium]|nr:UDP-3-O-(3-hydroxymyristoyl)glucosamine N-acyltransferase [Gaiellaceae bacterium]